MRRLSFSVVVAMAWPSFGTGCATTHVRFVSSQRADLVGVRGTLGTARCRTPPDADGVTLRRADVERVGCRTSPFSGVIEVRGLDEDGASGSVVARVLVVEGRYSLRFAELEARSNAAMFVLGDGGWAGAIRLPIEPRRRAHALAVRRGRGSAELLAAVRDPALPAREIWSLATQARLIRQERDHELVRAGVLSPARFLQRHPWSPYRESVLATIAEPGGSTDRNGSTDTGENPRGLR